MTTTTHPSAPVSGVVTPCRAPKTTVAPPLIGVGLLTAVGAHDPAVWAPVLWAACARQGVTTPLRVAAFLANVFVETGHLSTISENLDYSSQALMEQWPSHFTEATAQRLGRTTVHPADQVGIANLAYGGRMGNSSPGDGWLFRGGGCLQTTGRAGYQALAHDIGWTGSPEALTAYVRTPVGAAESAASYWVAHKVNIPADRGDLTTTRRLVNGGTTGLTQCQAAYAAVLAALKKENIQ